MNDRMTAMDSFLADAGWAQARRDLLAGDASNRRYDRLTLDDGRTAVLMDAHLPVGCQAAADHARAAEQVVVQVGEVPQCVRASVVGVKTSKKRINLSLRMDDGTGSSRVCVGAKVQGIVTRVAKSVGLMVQLGSHSVGRVHLTDMADELRDDPCSSYDVGQAIQVRILHVSSNGEVDLSLRESRLGNKRKKAMDPEIEDIATLVPGERVKGYVKSTSKQGCFVSLSRRALPHHPEVASHWAGVKTPFCFVHCDLSRFGRSVCFVDLRPLTLPLLL